MTRDLFNTYYKVPGCRKRVKQIFLIIKINFFSKMNGLHKYDVRFGTGDIDTVSYKYHITIFMYSRIFRPFCLTPKLRSRRGS